MVIPQNITMLFTYLAMVYGTVKTYSLPEIVYSYLLILITKQITNKTSCVITNK